MPEGSHSLWLCCELKQAVQIGLRVAVHYSLRRLGYGPGLVFRLYAPENGSDIGRRRFLSVRPCVAVPCLNVDGVKDTGNRLNVPGTAYKIIVHGYILGRQNARLFKVFTGNTKSSCL